jgi:hypothetical protein
VSTMKRKIPTTTPYQPAEEQLNFLAQWLVEREWDQQLEDLSGIEEGVVSPGVDRSKIKDLIRPYHAEISEGQIRLLAPGALDSQDRMLYVAVLKAWDDGEWLVAPFSQYTVPSLPGELALPFDQIHLKSLCLWNAHSVPASKLRRSWVDGVLEAQDMAEAWNVFRYVATGEPLSAELLKKTGPHVCKASDPRVEYQRQESQLMGRLCANASILQFTSGYKSAWFDYSSQDLLMAAADDMKHSRCVVIEPDGMDVHHRLYAQCEDLDKSAESISCEWWLDGFNGEISSGLAFINGKALGELQLFPRQDGLLLQLDASLSAEQSAVLIQPSGIELVLIE